jgi:hypothetical protein
LEHAALQLKEFYGEVLLSFEKPTQNMSET